MSAVENLRAARAWLGEGEHRWTQKGSYGQALGRAVAVTKATSCCALGALGRVCERHPFDVDATLLEDAMPPGWSSIEEYNDSSATTYPDILALYDRAIELAEQAEGGAA